MRGGDLLAFAAGALRGHRLRTSLSLLGVAIGVAAVLLLTSLGEGARRYVTGEFALLGSNLVIVLTARGRTTAVVLDDSTTTGLCSTTTRSATPCPRSISTSP